MKVRTCACRTKPVCGRVRTAGDGRVWAEAFGVVPTEPPLGDRWGDPPLGLRASGPSNAAVNYPKRWWRFGKPVAMPACEAPLKIGGESGAVRWHALQSAS